MDELGKYADSRSSKENEMFAHPDLLSTVIKQHVDDLQSRAEHQRVLTLALRRRRRLAARREGC